MVAFVSGRLISGTIILVSLVARDGQQTADEDTDTSRDAFRGHGKTCLFDQSPEHMERELSNGSTAGARCIYLPILPP